MTAAKAFWVEHPGEGVLRDVDVAPPGPSDARVRTLHTGISRGTESLVFRGEVPAGERQRMRAPHQQGELPGPVAYGYLNVGVVEAGPAELQGRTVFTLYPHQSVFTVPATDVHAVPDDVPARRAVLAGAVETAVNILWDAAPLVGDRVVVIGAGMIGCAVARLARGIPGVEVTLVDVDATKAAVSERLDVAYAEPADAPRGCDVTIHVSGSSDGLQLALECAPTEGEIIEASWFGDREVALRLGGDFHSRRLTIRSSQVGMLAPRRRGSRTPADRLALALELLRDDAFDVLLTDRSPWHALPEVMSAIASGRSPGLCHTIDWEDAG